MDGYAKAELPTDRFDDSSTIPKQVKTLCDVAFMPYFGFEDGLWQLKPR